MGLKGGVRRNLKRLFFPLRCANDIRYSIRSLRPSLAEVRLSVGCLLALRAMSQALHEACSLRRCYFVHVAGQLGHTLLKARILHGQESGSVGL